MNCPKCGTDNRNSAAFCSSCGNRMITSNSEVFVPDSGEEGRIVGHTSSGYASPTSLQSGRYLIEKMIGAGGMGRVYLATDTRMKSRIVVKEMFNLSLPPDKIEYFERRFEEEARILFKLKHPFLPKVTDYFSESGNMYMIMEFIEGENLDDILKKKPGGRIDPDECREWLGHIVDIIHYLHHLDPPVIHRDIKPANLMIDPDGKIFLVDFGVARSIDQSARTQTRVGTFGFASPEHFSGKFSLSSDIYSLGATFHYLLSGDDPQERDTFTYPPLSDYRDDISKEFQKILDKMLAQERKDRYRDTDELKRDIDRLESVRTEKHRATKTNEAIGTPFMKKASAIGNVETGQSSLSDRPEIEETIPIEESATAGKKVAGDEESPPAHTKYIKRKPIAASLILILIIITATFLLRGIPGGKLERVIGTTKTIGHTNEPSQISSPKKPTHKETEVIVPANSGNADTKLSLQHQKSEEYFQKGKSFLDAGKFERAIVFFDESLKLNNEFIPAYFGRARAYTGLERSEEAYNDLSSVIRLDPKNVEALIARGNVSIEKEVFDQAIMDFDRAIRIDPQNAGALVGRGWAYHKLKNNEEALKNLDTAIRLSPDNGEAYIRRGKFYKEISEYNKAIADYNRALNIAGVRAEAYNGLGDVYLKDNKFDLALKNFNKAIKYRPDYEDAINNRGICYYSMKEYDRAIKEFTDTIKLNDGLSNAYYNRGKCYADKHKYNGAIADFNKAISLSPGDPVYYNDRGLAYLELGKKKLAINDFEKAIELDPDMDAPYINRGLIYHQEGNHNKAIEYYNKAIEKNPENPVAYYNRAEVFFETSRYGEARANLEKTISLDPDGDNGKSAARRLKDLEEKGF